MTTAVDWDVKHQTKLKTKSNCWLFHVQVQICSIPLNPGPAEPRQIVFGNSVDPDHLASDEAI